MEVKKEYLVDFLGKNRNLIIPVYQRNYAWKERECKRLFEDIVNIYTDKLDKYFMGAVVIVGDGDRTSQLIDGQQRMTSISLLLLAMSNLLKLKKIKSIEEKLADHIWNQHLVNKRISNDDDKYIKLKQVNQDDKAYKNLFLIAGCDSNSYDNAPELKKTDIYKNYMFFEKKIKEFCKDKNFDDIWSAFEKIEIAIISLDIRYGDKPQVVFETINSTGKALEDSDLIRNYILMNEDLETQEKWFKNYWEDIEKYTYIDNKSDTTDAIRCYLMYSQKVHVKITDTYDNFKSHIDGIGKNSSRDGGLSSVEIFLQELKTFSKYYKWFSVICDNTEFEKRFKLFRQIKQTTPYPYFMSLMNLYEKEDLEENIVCQVLDFILSYHIRRSVLDKESNVYNKTYVKLLKKIDVALDNTCSINDGYLNALYTVFANLSDRDKYPDDKGVKAELSNKNFYKSKIKKIVLEKMCNLDTKEKILIDDNITIEHIMPQTLTEHWKRDLGNEWESIYEKYLHTIGNLTLTGYNKKYNNKPFQEKKKLIAEYSNISINKYFKNVNSWGENSIIENANRMIKLFNEAYPDIKNRDDYKEKQEGYLSLDELDPTGKKVHSYKLLGDVVEVENSSWKYLFGSVCKQLYELDSEVFLDYIKDEKNYSDREDNGFSNPLMITDNLYFEGHRSAKSSVDYLIRILSAYDYSDEFFVKLKDKDT